MNWIDDPYVAARFWIKAKDTGYCWEWTGSKDRHGYGTFKPDPKGSPYGLERPKIPFAVQEFSSLTHLESSNV